MKSEYKWKTMIKFCKSCERMTVHALSSTGSFWACGCGEIIRIDTVSESGAENGNSSKR